MTFPWNDTTTKTRTDEYATSDDFCGVFADGMDDLYQLTFLLTRDCAKAEQCFVAGLEDCLATNRVFRKWARSWAKRTIIQKAIRLLQPHPDRNGPSGNSDSRKKEKMRSPSDGYFERDRVLALEDFERFVFALSVLEKYSLYECAVLLECLPQEVRDAQEHALREVADQNQEQTSAFTHSLRHRLGPSKR